MLHAVCVNCFILLLFAVKPWLIAIISIAVGVALTAAIVIFVAWLRKRAAMSDKSIEADLALSQVNDLQSDEPLVEYL